VQVNPERVDPCDLTLGDHNLNLTLVDHNIYLTLVDHNRNMTSVDHNRNLAFVDLNTSNNLSTLKEYIYCIYGTENRKEETFSTHEHKQSLRTFFVSVSLQMIQVYDLLTDPVVQSVTRFFRPAALPCYDTVFCSAVIGWFTVCPTENHEEETVEVTLSLSEKRCC